MLIMPGGKSWTLPNSGPDATDPSWRGWKPGDQIPQQTPQPGPQKNDQQLLELQGGPGNWAYSQSPSPSGGSKSPDMSAWGKAQPIPPPSRGTPYGQSGGFGAPKPMSQDFGAFSPPTFTYGEQQSPMGNWGNSQYGRPQGFQASYFDMRGNPVSAEQQQAQRAAMVLQLQQAQMPYVLGNAMNQNLGKPQFDFNTMLQSANEAVKNGFYNPFQRFYEEQDAIQRLGQQAPPSMYQAPTDPADGSLPYNDTPVLRRPADYGVDWFWSRPRTKADYGRVLPDFSYGGDMTAPPQPVLTQQPQWAPDSGPPWMRPGAAQPVAPPSTGRPYGSPHVLYAPEPEKKRARPQAPAQQPTYNPAQDEVNVYARYAEESSRRAQKELRDMQERFRDLPGKAAQLDFERRQNAKPWPRDKFGRLIRR